MLLSGPKKLSELENEIKEGCTNPNLDATIEGLLEKGLIIQDKQGFRLDENYGLYLAAVIKAVGLTLFGNLTAGGRGISVNHQDG